MRLVFFLVIFLLSSCTTIVGKKLQSVTISGIESKKSIVIYSPHSPYLFNRQELETYLNDSKVFSKVKVQQEYDFLDTKEKYDLIMETSLARNGFFEPYCIFTLMIIPCTPPLKLTIASKVTDTNSNKSASFTLEESATKLTWLFGFLFPGFKDSDKAVDEFNKNIINHIILKIKETKLL